MMDCSKWLFLHGLHTFNQSVLFTMLYMIHPNLVSVSVVVFSNITGMLSSATENGVCNRYLYTLLYTRPTIEDMRTVTAVVCVVSIEKCHFTMKLIRKSEAPAIDFPTTLFPRIYHVFVLSAALISRLLHMFLVVKSSLLR